MIAMAQAIGCVGWQKLVKSFFFFSEVNCLGLRSFDVFANGCLWLVLAVVWQVARAITPEKRGRRSSVGRSMHSGQRSTVLLRLHV